MEKHTKSELLEKLKELENQFKNENEHEKANIINQSIQYLDDSQTVLTDVWYIYCSTGCTCCEYENFNHGFYFSQEEAQEQADEWLKGNNNPLASQFAKYGRYKVRKTNAELLTNGFMIVDSLYMYKQDTRGKVTDGLD